MLFVRGFGAWFTLQATGKWFCLWTRWSCFVFPLTVVILGWPVQGHCGACSCLCSCGCSSLSVRLLVNENWPMCGYQKGFFRPVFCSINPSLIPVHCPLGYETCNFGIGKDDFAILVWTGSTWVLAVPQPFPGLVPRWWHISFSSPLGW